MSVASVGTGVDEVFQMLPGSGFVIHQRLDDQATLTVRLSCSRAEQGWLGTYSGTRPHIGSVSSAALGSKFLVQVMGAGQWTLLYVDSARGL